MTTPRILRTVLFTDIVGSTQKAATLGDTAWSDLLRRHHAVVEREVDRRGGQIAGTTGDGTVAVFDGPTPAILAALSIRDAVRELDLEIRAGIQMGEVIRSATAIEGIGVHIGARVAAEAAPGEVLVSSTVHDAEAGSDLRFADRGRHTLKGVPGEWRLYSVEGTPGAPTPPTEDPSRVPARSSRRAIGVAAVAGALALLLAYWLFSGRSDVAPPEAIAGSAAPGIAILPFTVNDPELDRWREGMVDLLSTNLDGVGGLRAIDNRTVLTRWRRAVPEGESGDLATALRVAREAGGRYALLGNAVTSGTDLRLSAEVYDLTGDGHSLGQEQVQGSQDSIFVLVDRLSIALLARILEEERVSISDVDLSRITTTSIPALKAYLEGESFLRRSRFEAASEALERAITADSTFALAWYRLSEAAGWTDILAGSPRSTEARERAWTLRERLPDRERELIEVMDAQQEGRPETAELARAAVEEYPDSPRAWYLLGEWLYHFPHRTLPGRPAREAPFLRAVGLDPLYTPAYIHLLDLAFGHADSAAVARTLPGYARGAGGSAHDRQYRLAQGLAWGSSATQSAALAALDTVPQEVLERVPFLLGHPRFLAHQQQVLAELRRRPGVSPAQIGGLLAANALARGKLRDLVGIVEDPASGANPGAYVFWLHTHVWMGLADSVPLDRRRIDGELAPPENEPDASVHEFLRAGAYAIENDRGENYAQTIRALRAAIAEADPSDDSPRTRDLSGALGALLAYEDVARGGTGALERMDEAARASPPWTLQSRMVYLLLRAGRTEEALRYVGALGPQPWLGSAAARLYEQVGDRDRAIEAWSWVRDGWREADPELQPRVFEAEREIERLRRSS